MAADPSDLFGSSREEAHLVLLPLQKTLLRYYLHRTLDTIALDHLHFNQAFVTTESSFST